MPAKNYCYKFILYTPLKTKSTYENISDNRRLILYKKQSHHSLHLPTGIGWRQF